MSQTAASSAPGMETAYWVPPMPIAPKPMVALRMRLLGESWAGAEGARAAPVSRKRLLVGMNGIVAPGCQAGGLSGGCTMVAIMERRRFLQSGLAGLALSATSGYSEQAVDLPAKR